jgi:tetratricopeptide (TPR) repeat protein
MINLSKIMNYAQRIILVLNNHFQWVRLMNEFKLSLMVIISASLFLNTTITYAESYAISGSEARQLPPFCMGLSIGNFEDDAKSLKRDIKMPGEHTQHFCHGMKSLIRGDRGDKSQYQTAVSEFEYVQEHSTSQHELMDSVSLYKAEALGKLGKTGPAITEYNKAIQLNNKYHQAYARLADYYLTLGMKQDAIDTIKIGLRFSPESKGLKNRLHKLSADK